MTSASPTITDRGGAFIAANGIDIHYQDVGSGEPLLLLHGGVVSTGPVWDAHPFAYNRLVPALAEHFRVIAPDTRGAGATVNDGRAASFDRLADDVVALIDGLGLDRPMVAGFSEGGITATIVGMRSPGVVRAVVNHAGFDLFDPDSPSFTMMRMMLGGAPDATEADPDAAARFFGQSDEMRMTFDLLRADHDAAQGDGYWRTYLSDAFARTTTSPGYTFDDLAAVRTPTLIVTGDRDEFCSVDDAVRAYRRLPTGELAVLARQPHCIPEATLPVLLDFLTRHVSS
jgi:pimeloyl-ACP methyl ester carboxylesterase